MSNRKGGKRISVGTICTRRVHALAAQHRGGGFVVWRWTGANAVSDTTPSWPSIGAPLQRGSSERTTPSHHRIRRRSRRNFPISSRSTGSWTYSKDCPGRSAPWQLCPSWSRLASLVQRQFGRALKTKRLKIGIPNARKLPKPCHRSNEITSSAQSHKRRNRESPTWMHCASRKSLRKSKIKKSKSKQITVFSVILS